MLRREIKAARKSHVPDNFIKRVIQFAKQGYTDIDFPIYDTDWDSDAYLTVSGQNSNNSVRVTDEFLKAVEADGDWDLTWRTKPARSPRPSRRATCGRRSATPPGPAPIPACSIHTTINDWHTCPAVGADPRLAIRARNTCSSTTPPAISRR